MSKFYKHDREASLARTSIRRDKAGKQMEIPTLAEYAILHLIDINERGLPDCYKVFGDFLYDFWPDFSWNCLDRVPEIQAVLDDSRFKEIIPALNAEWGIDIVQILTKGLKEQL